MNRSMAPAAPRVAGVLPTTPRSWFASVILVLVSLASAPAEAQRPPAFKPATSATVVERLPAGYPTPASSRPGAATLAQVEQLQQASARTGDARLSTRADALLARLPERRTAAALRAQAYGAQHRHDFTASMALLDAAVRADPRDAGARLARAQLHLVQGRIRAARGDCAALSIGVDAEYGQACLTAFLLRTGELARAASTADAWLARNDVAASLRSYMLTMRAETASRAGSDDADQWFRTAMQDAAGDVRVSIANARHLLRNDRGRDALAVLADAPGTDTVALLRALALHASSDPGTGAAIDGLAVRYATAHAVGMEPELRDEAEYLLALRGDAAGALALAQRNFLAQRDFEDVDILQRAALAAGREDALVVLRDWASAEGIALPAGNRARGKTK